MNPNPFEKAFADVQVLIEQFSASRDKYLKPDYNETQARKDYLDKFFVALGWDVNHETQTNPYEQEVKVERNVKVSARVKKADFAFFLTPNFRNARFFVEAKKPSSPLETPDNCFQTIRYGYSSSRAAISILTNFLETFVIDCRYTPDINTATKQIVKTFSYVDFADKEKFSEFYYLFAREAVAGGSLETFAETLPKPKGKVKQRKLFTDTYQEIDEAFLETLESYRKDLAKMFKRKNPQLNSEDLTEATQRTLDRLVFIRFLEDKLIEPDTILDKFGDKPHPWSQFIGQSERLNKIYNGIIFKDHPIVDAQNFQVDDKIFSDICDDFASDRSPYHFAYIPIHILGSIYERFLGKVIVATAKLADVVEKPEVRKAGGVFYTPEYIVSYIVEHTIGGLLEKKSPGDVSEMRFADIACGSGSFLLGVYDYLIRWHTKYYNLSKNKTAAKKAGCVAHEDGTFHLSFEQKREILVKNIYGVDIDRQAYEVSQLSLFLKLLEEETQGSKQSYLRGFREALLPSLTNNIVCGNALVDWDVSSGDLLEQLDSDKERKLNPMSFTQKFPEVMRREGFDAVVGNPPYGMIEDSELKEYFSSKFVNTEGRFDNYELFIEKALSLCNNKGVLGYIVPSPLLSNLYTRKLRRYLLDKTNIKEIINFKIEVFADPTVHTCIAVVERAKTSENVINIKKSINRVEQLKDPYDYSIPQSDFGNNPNSTFDIFVNRNDLKILEKLNSHSMPLGTMCYIRQCIKTGDDSLYIVESEESLGKDWKKSLRGRSIGRYVTLDKNLWIKYGDWLARNWKNKSFYETPKIAIRETGNRIIATLDLEYRYFLSSLYAVYPTNKRDRHSLHYLLAILNSNLAMYFLKIVALNLTEGAFTKFRTNQIARLPIRVINFNDTKEKSIHDKLLQKVNQIMHVKRAAIEVANEHEKEFWENKCEALESNINQIVYDLYGMTTEDIELIENS